MSTAAFRIGRRGDNDKLVTPDGITSAPEESGFATALGLLRRHAALIAGIALIAALAAFAVSAPQQKRYRGEAVLLAGGGDSAATTGAAPVDPVRSLETLVRLAQTDGVLEVGAREAHTTVATLAPAVSVSGAADADILVVRATATSPTLAARYANGLATGLVEWESRRNRAIARARIAALRQQLRQFAGRTSPSAVAATGDLRTQLSEASAELSASGPGVAVVSRAVPPSKAYTPRPFRNALLGLLAGLIVGIAAAALRDRLDRRIRSAEELERLYDLPVLGVVPFVRSGARQAASASRSGPVAEAFRTIRTNLTLFQLDRHAARVLVVSSAVGGEGKTSATANLAQVFADAGREVLVVSADVRSPALHQYFEGGTNGRHPAGLVEVLSGEVPLEEAVREHLAVGAGTGEGAIWLLANDSTFIDPAVLFASKAMADLLKRARREYETVLIDAPPLLAGAEAALLGTQADALVLVADPGKLTRKQIQRARSVLEAAGVRPVGMIVTGQTDTGEALYGYGAGTPVSRTDKLRGWVRGATNGAPVPDRPRVRD